MQCFLGVTAVYRKTIFLLDTVYQDGHTERMNVEHPVWREEGKYDAKPAASLQCNAKATRRQTAAPARSQCLAKPQTAPAATGGRGAHIRFCETNPFHFVGICVGSILFAGTYGICRSACKWVRSGKRTHLLRRNHVAASRLTRFEGVLD